MLSQAMKYANCEMCDGAKVAEECPVVQSWEWICGEDIEFPISSSKFKTSLMKIRLRVWGKRDCK